MIELDKTFIFLELIGEGGFGKVYKVQYKEDNQIYALKLMNKDLDFIKITNEFNLLKLLDSPYIPKYFALEKAYYAGNEYIMLMMEYIDGNDLSEYILDKHENKNTFTLSEITRVMRDTLRAVTYLHSHEIAHRDIKPDNIRIAKDRVVLVDYGFACIAKFKSIMECKGRAGTRHYMAPEIVNENVNLKEHPDLWLKADMFSLGQTFWTMTNLANPTPQVSRPSIYPVPEVVLIIKRLTNPVPETRLSAQGALTLTDRMIKKYFPNK